MSKDDHAETDISKTAKRFRPTGTADQRKRQLISAFWDENKNAIQLMFAGALALAKQGVRWVIEDELTSKGDLPASDIIFMVEDHQFFVRFSSTNPDELHPFTVFYSQRKSDKAMCLASIDMASKRLKKLF
jgi:hypothetical protein